MFCLKCGKKLVRGQQICSFCNTPVSGNEYCGGFWGLTGEIRNLNSATQGPSSMETSVVSSIELEMGGSGQPIHSTDGAPVQVTEVTNEKEEKKGMRRGITWSMAIIMLLICIMMAWELLSIQNMKRTIAQFGQDIQTISGEMKNTSETNDLDDFTKQYNEALSGISQQMNDLENKVDTMKEFLESDGRNIYSELNLNHIEESKEEPSKESEEEDKDEYEDAHEDFDEEDSEEGEE